MISISCTGKNADVFEQEMVTLPVTVVRLGLEYAIIALQYIRDYCISLEVV